MKYLIIILSLILLILAYNSNFFKSGFKFESYTETGRNTKLTEVLRRDHPIGSDGVKLKEKLEKAGASCRYVPKNGLGEIRKKMGAQEAFVCDYRPGWLSLFPLYSYSVWFSLDRSEKVVTIDSDVIRGIV